MKTLSRKFLKAVSNCDEVQLDLAFAALKYRELGILRKIRCFAFIFFAQKPDSFARDEAELIESMPATTDGRVLDKPSRTLVHDALIERVKNGQGDE